MSTTPDKSPDKSMTDILASIRKIVEEGPAPEAVEIDEVVVTPVPPPPALVLPPPDTTIEALVRSMLEPQLKAWLDGHLPEIVERLTREQIMRLTKR